ncbi:Polynucleotidyl transferase- ribonuclease H-like superfamily protein [Striga hermonthica]|uniref:Polynucleotidyl transferase- ribonuclease H-like superfamily protein n=1 Tax=Striga hermonthica TaxID=68872 RepID=A0A9N7NUU7_STRHE|nr:Polynucleotidyl transferase- ribonuclease H-like superfamily protein [Striga hermonthica]
MAAPTLQRVRHFLWVAARNQLFTNGERMRRHLTDDGECGACGQLETTLHVLRDCPQARMLWDILIPRSHRIEFFSLDLRPWLWCNLLDARVVDLVEWATIFSTACWRIWIWRNMAVFSHKLVPLETKVQDVRRRVEQYWEATSYAALLGSRARQYESDYLLSKLPPTKDEAQYDEPAGQIDGTNVRPPATATIPVTRLCDKITSPRFSHQAPIHSGALRIGSSVHRSLTTSVGTAYRVTQFPSGGLSATLHSRGMCTIHQVGASDGITVDE